METVRLEIEHDIATITLDRPNKLNALNTEMLGALETIIRDIDQRVDVRVVLLTGAGAKSFCVGADIKTWSALAPIEMWRRWVRDGHRVFDQLAHLRQPTIAVLNGYTLGGGLELALATDIRLAAETVSLGQPEVKLAILPGWGGTQRLTALIGVARAKQLIFSGEQISAQTAESWGLVNEVLPVDELMPRAYALAAQIGANAPLAVQFAKQVIDAGTGLSVGSTLEALAGALSAMSQDGREGLAAFEEHRAGIFTGK